jgi:hypothetical protein
MGREGFLIEFAAKKLIFALDGKFKYILSPFPGRSHPIFVSYLSIYPLKASESYA